MVVFLTWAQKAEVQPSIMSRSIIRLGSVGISYWSFLRTSTTTNLQVSVLGNQKGMLASKPFVQAGNVTLFNKTLVVCTSAPRPHP
jgi:hypothetical protein